MTTLKLEVIRKNKNIFNFWKRCILIIAPYLFVFKYNFRTSFCCFDRQYEQIINIENTFFVTQAKFI
jgi:hypothetical protein